MMTSGGAAIIDKPWPCKPRYSEYLWSLCFFCELLLNFHTAARAQAVVLLLSLRQTTVVLFDLLLHSAVYV